MVWKVTYECFINAVYVNLNRGEKMRTILVTNATQYSGPGAVDILLKQGAKIVCHDPTFCDSHALQAFQKGFPEAECLQGVDPASLAVELDARGIQIDAVVSNDVYPITTEPIEELSIDILRKTFEAVLVFPIELTKLLLPSMKARKSGSFVFVTSARSLRPEQGFAVPTSIRAGTTAFALALSKEVAHFGIQVNVVAPNYLYSEMYYPRAKFIDDAKGRDHIADMVPMGRLGTPSEIGELIAFFASGRSTFVTGQVIHFTGGWP